MRSTLYWSTSPGGVGELWTIDQTTGAAIADIGPLSDSGGQNYGVTGLAFDPTSGILYGSTGGKSGNSLLTIDPATARVTVVGDYGLGAGDTMTDIKFDTNGTLYGITSTGGANLCTINKSTGQATIIGISGVSFTQGGALAISPGGVFYASPINTDFGTYNPTTGAFTFIANPPRPGGSGTSYSAFAFDGETLYGMNLATPTYLVTIDPFGDVTTIGTSVANIDGIAFRPSAARPSLSIQATGTNVTVAWPTSATGFRLQQNTNLLSTNWISSPGPTNVVGTNNEVTITPARGDLYFRLITP